MNINQKIKQELLRIEKEFQVRIFYACESGSRAWGFPSKDSDYDVRFLYVHRPDWYLSVDVERKRDVIERPISESLDVGGWDLRKACQLLLKSNPPLLEWLNSPVVYRERYGVTRDMRAILKHYYKPISCHYHYLQMAKNNYKAYLRGNRISHKKYFYVLRPLLAIKWIKEDRGPIPVFFSDLVEILVKNRSLKKEIQNLIQKKKRGKEIDRGPKIKAISNFIESELRKIEKERVILSGQKTEIEKLNTFFRRSLKSIWR